MHDKRADFANLTRRRLLRAGLGLPVLAFGLAACQSSGGYMGQTEYRVPPRRTRDDLAEEALAEARNERGLPGGRSR